MAQSSARLTTRLDGLTSLRFVAAALVVLTHCHGDVFRFVPVGLSGFLKDGYESVSFFFMLSGFVLAYGYYTPTSPYFRGGNASFWKSRFARIYPIYLVSLLVALPMYVYSIKIGMVQPRDARVALIAVPLLMQSWFAVSRPAISGAINLPAWSLSVEAFFYVTFPVVLRTTIAIGPVLTTSLAYVGLICSDVFISHDYYFPPYHLFTFIMGVGCGVWFRKVSPIKMRAALYCTGVLLFGIFAFRELLPSYAMSRPVIIPLFGALIVTTASCAGTLKVLENRFLVMLGDSSYSLYILHLPIFLLFEAALKRIHPTAGENVILTICYLPGIVGLSIVSYKLIEIPVRSKLLKMTVRTLRQTALFQPNPADRTT